MRTSASSTAAELGGAADLGGEMATTSRTSQSDAAALSGHSRKRCNIVSFVPVAKHAGVWGQAHAVRRTSEEHARVQSHMQDAPAHSM